MDHEQERGRRGMDNGHNTGTIYRRRRERKEEEGDVQSRRKTSIMRQSAHPE
jgi:hypothetical protein